MFSNNFRHLLFAAAFSGAILTGSTALGQQANPPDSKTSKDQAQQAQQQAQQDQSSSKPRTQTVDPLSRQVDPKTRKKQEKAWKTEVSKVYKKWLDEDVPYIITGEEAATFKQLSTDEERDNFIENFWYRRDPTPDTPENEFKEEHYRRIAYANEHFPSGVPGWKTDRGRMYITWGPADQVETHPAGGAYTRPIEEGGGSTSTYPFETWRYRYLEGIGQEIEIEFVDTCGCGEYHMTIDRSEKDALKYVPNAGLTDYEAMGIANKKDRFNGSFEQLGAGPFSYQNSAKQFDRMETFAKLNHAPDVKFHDLETQVTTKIRTNLLPFNVRADFVKLTSDTVLVPLTVQIQNKDVTFQTKDGVSRAQLEIVGRVTNMTGRIMQSFDDPLSLESPSELLQQKVNQASVYWKALPLRPGAYKVDIYLKDVNGDRLGVWTKGIKVPDFPDDKLTNSTLILADDMQKVPARNVGTGDYVIGGTKVRPRVETGNGKPATFKKDQKVNFWMQVYNLQLDEKTKKPSAEVEYNVVNTADNKAVIHAVETTEKMGNVGDQLTLEKSLSAANLPPGIYQVTINVKDNFSKQTITQAAKFAVEQ